MAGYDYNDAAVVNGALNTLGTTYMGSMQSTFGMKNTKKLMALEQEYNEKNMALQNQYAQMNVESARRYNDPGSVAQRYRNAGLSPQAAMNGSASGAGVQSSVPGAPDSSAPTAVGKNIPTSLSEMAIDQSANLSRMMAETANIRADTKLKLSQSGNSDVDTEGKELQNSLFSYIREITANNARSSRSKAEKDEVEVALSKLRVLIESKDYEKAQVEIDNLIKQGKLSDQELLNLQKAGVLLDSQNATEKEKPALIRSETEKNKSETSNIEKDTEKKGHEIANLKIIKSHLYNQVNHELEKMKLTRAEVARALEAFDRYLDGLPETNEMDVWKIPFMFLNMVSRGVPEQFMDRREFYRRYIIEGK